MDSVSCECCVLSGGGFSDGPEISYYGVWYVSA